jgi:AAA+ superfamily predicted ATPase
MKFKYRVLHLVKRTVFWLGVAWLSLWLIRSPNWEIIKIALQVAMQVLIVVIFVGGQILMFVYFMARTRDELILPGSPMATTLDDYWGQPRLKELVQQWVILLKNPKAYRMLGGLKPKGALLEGPPGFGKSFLAKCIAGSAGIPFISMDAASLRSVWMGIGSVKIMMKFGKARKLAQEYGSCIFFMDEIDAIGASRYGVVGNDRPGVKPMIMGGMGGSSGGGELNTLLYELDGKIPALPWWLKPFGLFIRLVNPKWMPPESSDVVFFMGATNRPDILDPALTRAGRLNRRIPVDRPDWEGRREILKGYVGQVRSKDIDFDALTDETAYMSPADIRQLTLEEATRKAHFASREYVTMQDFEESISEIHVGLKNPFASLRPEERKALAVHEAGHAVLAWVLTDHRISKVTIQRYGSALGHVLPIEVKERNLRTLRDYYHSLVISMGGRAGEVVAHELMSSVGGDYPSVMSYGGWLLSRGMWGTPVNTEAEASLRFRALFNVGLEDAVRLLRKYALLHNALIEALLMKDELNHAEVEALFQASGQGERPVEKLSLPTEPALADLQAGR